MKRTPFVLTTSLATIALGLLAACAAMPAAEGSAIAASPDCTALDAEIARTAEAQRAAALKQQDAWKAVVPFAVAARYGQGMAQVTESQRRLSELRAQAARLDCREPSSVSGAAGSGLSSTAPGQGLRVRSFN